MAAHPVVTVGDGIIEIPEDLKGDPRFQKGALLELVPIVEAKIEEQPRGDWRRLEGILKNRGFDPNADLEIERQQEIERDKRWGRD